MPVATRPVPTLSARPRRPRSLAPAAALLLALATGCARRPDDPALAFIRETLRKGDRLILLRVLDVPAQDHLAAVVAVAGGKPELRLYERQAGGPYALALTEQQGDAFANLALEDVNADGQDEILATWSGGHLETLEVLGRTGTGGYRNLFLNAGRQIEKRYDAAGRVEFWITSRTYAEGAGQPPAYETSVFRWDGERFSEAKRR